MTILLFSLCDDDRSMAVLYVNFIHIIKTSLIVYGSGAPLILEAILPDVFTIVQYNSQDHIWPVLS